MSILAACEFSAIAIGFRRYAKLLGFSLAPTFRGAGLDKLN